MKPSFYVCTLGCKVNAYESAATAALFLAKGYERSQDPSAADVLLVNTCSVTSKAGQKSRQHISSLRKKNPSAILLVMGCYSQAYAKQCLQAGADIVLGTAVRNKAFEYVARFASTHERICDVSASVRKETYEELEESAFCENARAYLKVQDGCDAFCSYCYIPQLRGNSRSRDPRKVLEEAKRLVASGYREIVITGIHTGMYGKDLAGEYRFADLLESLLTKCPDLKRLRISSLEQNELDDAFLSLLRRFPALVDHLHVPLQSGSAKVLRDMHRRYAPEEFLARLEAIREIRPEIAITTDVIVGYPTEGEAEFLETLELCAKARFAEIHVFPFSSRPNTFAATLPDLSPEVKKERVHRLLALSKKLRLEYEEKFYGRDVSVLVETYDPSTHTVQGHTPNYLLVRFPGDETMRETFQTVRYDSSTASD